VNHEPWPDHASIVVLGDSLVTGVGVGLDGTFTELIAHMLPDDVVNLGLAGAGLERQYPIYRRFGRPLRPRIVVAGLYLAADFDNDMKFRAWLKEGRGTDYNQFRTAYGARVAGRPEYASPMTLLLNLELGRLLEKSRLYLRAADFAGRLTSDSGGDLYHFADGTTTFLDRVKIEFASAAASPDDPRIDALMRALERLKILAAETRSDLVVMLIPSKEELFGVSPEVASRNIVARTRQRLVEAHVPLIDLYPAIRAAAAQQAPYFEDDIHLNAYGNRVAAEEFIAWLSSREGRPRGQVARRNSD
jgi:lysophospholipase L1-like esterase